MIITIVYKTTLLSLNIMFTERQKEGKAESQLITTEWLRIIINEFNLNREDWKLFVLFL